MILQKTRTGLEGASDFAETLPVSYILDKRVSGEAFFSKNLWPLDKLVSGTSIRNRAACFKTRCASSASPRTCFSNQRMRTT